MLGLRARKCTLVIPAGIEGQLTDKRERRYLTTTLQAQAIADVLAGHEDPDHPSYRVTSTYLTQAGTPYRVRQYGSGTDLRLESKQRIGGRVLKARFVVGDTISRATYEGTCSYHRQAYQVDNARITIDHDVRTLGRTLGMVVVEVKGETVPVLLDVLLPEETLAFGKRKWALG